MPFFSHKVMLAHPSRGLFKKEKPSDSHQTVSASKPKHPRQGEPATSPPVPDARGEDIIRSSPATGADTETEDSHGSFQKQSSKMSSKDERDATPANKSEDAPGDDAQGKPNDDAQYKRTALWSAAYEKLGSEERDLLKR
ncbi:uncharacterized protein BO95DRAFT_458571 [Aspergillus brunneoviolaceus CBS 621.78]|uniref:Uncharacterized protein n=1 Tax=Aspergillus brunneoviolaceus CBS 621.78 TaxID=1450534 RepID=A0ACD1GPP5_9EURO|nr:hypothetical protein BO95DRAFT_458571 [Aspergillus brunneoviolaceus CBS 621.78]RAH51218.1 hypothetical protein BO95DRAFT_458571 [Aspergillus brunneoviolaceus CBS 621.78]